MASKGIYVVSYEWRRLVGRKQWAAGANAFESSDDANHSADCMRDNPDSYRKVEVKGVALYPAGVFAGLIEKRKARIAAQGAVA